MVQRAGEGSDTEGKWAGEELHAKGKELELEGWRAWKAGIEAGAEAGQPRVVLEVVGGDTAEQGREEEGDENQEEVVPEAGAEAGVGQMMMWEGSEEEVGGDDAVEESGVEKGGYDLEEGAELSTEEEGTGAEAAGEAGHPMVVQQAEVGSDFAAQRREAGEPRELELEGWTLWKEGRAERFRDQGHSGNWYEGTMKWLQKDNAAWDAVWERKMSGRRGKEGEASLVSTGGVEVSRLRIGCREKQVQQEDEVAAVATAVKAEGSRGAQRKRGGAVEGGRRREGKQRSRRK